MKEEILCVLDASGSMISVASDAIEGFQSFIKKQKEIGEAKLTVVWFDDGWDLAYEGNLTDYEVPKTWPTGGMTALHDAIGKTFKHVKDRFSQEKPDKVIMAVLTDGYENDSHEFTKENITELIKDHESKYGWQVVFLAADQDAVAEGAAMGMQACNAINYTAGNTRKGFDSLTVAVSSYRA